MPILYCWKAFSVDFSVTSEKQLLMRSFCAESIFAGVAEGCFAMSAAICPNFRCCHSHPHTHCCHCCCIPQLTSCSSSAHGFVSIPKLLMYSPSNLPVNCTYCTARRLFSIAACITNSCMSQVKSFAIPASQLSSSTFQPNLSPSSARVCGAECSTTFTRALSSNASTYQSFRYALPMLTAITASIPKGRRCAHCVLIPVSPIAAMMPEPA